LYDGLVNAVAVADALVARDAYDKDAYWDALLVALGEAKDILAVIFPAQADVDAALESLALALEYYAVKTVSVEGVSVESRPYNGEAITVDGTAFASYEGERLPDSEQPEFTYTYTGTDTNGTAYEDTAGPVNAGTYELTIAVADTNIYYTGSMVISFTIQKRAATVKVRDEHMMTGGSIPRFTLEYENLVEGDVFVPDPAPEFSHDAVDVGVEGFYTITWINSDTVVFGDAVRNYEITKVSEGVLAISSNKAALAELIERARALNEADYSAGSYAALQWALDGAVSVYEDDTATSEDMIEAYGNLLAAMEELVEIAKAADKATLNDLLAQVDGMASDDYTPESWAEVAAAYTAGKAVNERADATKPEVALAIALLRNAMERLSAAGTEPIGPTNPAPAKPAPPRPPMSEINHYGTVPEAPEYWKTVNNTLQKENETAKEYTVNVDTGRNILLPVAMILDTLQGENGVLAMHTGLGVTFSVSSVNIPKKIPENNINLTIRSGDAAIPAQLVNAKTEGVIASKQIPMASHEDFGMMVNMHFSLGAGNADKYANLYRYNSVVGQLEYLGSYGINPLGQAMFGITGGAEYLLTVTDQKPDEKPISIGAGAYYVRSGDTLSSVARKHGVTLAAIHALNPEIMDLNKIRPGQVIKLK
jgi:hypothetical protein